MSPAVGHDTDTPVIITPDSCNDAAATHAQLYIYGAGFPADGYGVSANNSTAILPPGPGGVGYSVPLIDSLANVAAAQPVPVSYAGTYTIALACKGLFGSADYGDFVTSITFSDPTHYTNGSSISTTTTLTANPAASAVLGAPVTLAASVTPAGATGSVQFFDGTLSLGTAAVSGSAAVVTSSALTLGSHVFSAMFTPTGPAGTTTSTSAKLAYSIIASAPLPQAAAGPAVAHPSGLVLPVGTQLTCPDGGKLAIPAAELGKASVCSSGGPAVLVSNGLRPVALALPSLTGIPKVGKKLVLLPGVWTQKYTSRTVVWKRDGKTIAKASGGSYVVQKADKGHKISALVTVHLLGHPDGVASTSRVKPTGLPALVLPTDTVLSGVQGDSRPVVVPVGTVVGCVKGDFSGATSTTSGWFLDGQAYPGAVALVLPDALAGHQLICRTTGTNAGGTTTSDAVVTVGQGAPLLGYVAPRVGGTAEVGKTVTASAGKWYPGSTKASFVWLRNGKPIKGATKAAYRVTLADRKHKLSVRVTATRTGWLPGTATSVAVSVR